MKCNMRLSEHFIKLNILMIVFLYEIKNGRITLSMNS
jgi:hypothetical protein